MIYSIDNTFWEFFYLDLHLLPEADIEQKLLIDIGLAVLVVITTLAWCRR